MSSVTDLGKLAFAVAVFTWTPSVADAQTTSAAAEAPASAKSSAAEQVATHAHKCLKKNVVFPGPVTDFYFEYELIGGKREAALKEKPRSVSRTPGLQLAFARNLYHPSLRGHVPTFSECIAKVTLSEGAKETGTVSVHIVVSQEDGIEVVSKALTKTATEDTNGD